MTLYHFTAEHLARRIRQEGITKGCISLFDESRRFIGIERGWIWLTDDPSWQQEWCADRILVPYNRAAVRFEVTIPEQSMNCLYRAALALGVWFRNSEWLLECPGSEHWWLYRGKIFRKWLGRPERRIMEAHAGQRVGQGAVGAETEIGGGV